MPPISSIPVSTPVTVAVITTSRADFGHVVWPIKAMQAHPQINPVVIAMGAHMSAEFGHTLDAMSAQGIEVDETLETLLSSDTDTGMAKTIGISVLGLSDALSRLRPDLLLVIADRYEMLAVAAVAVALRIPIAHVEGGEISEGAIDDAVRNALTKLSHLHFAPHEQAARRIIAMGEEPWRVQVCGAPSLDHLQHRTLVSRTELETKLGITLQPAYALISLHPVTLLENTIAEAEAFYQALEKIAGQKIFCFPNCDAGGRALIKQAEQFCAMNLDAHLFVNLDHWDYWSVLHHAGVMLGNSSSALMEAPSVPLPAVNAGRRQQGRLMAKNVIDCEADSGAIVKAYNRAASPEFRATLTNMSNPYGDGHASERICNMIVKHRQRDRLLNKKARPLISSGQIDGFSHE